MTLIPIGRFARASRLSIKSLRNYDESGLLPAAFVDSQTNYRYYRLEQLVRADAIRSLRMVQMPLDQIGDVLDSGAPDGPLTAHLAALTEQRDELTRLTQQLRRQIERKEYVMSTEVTMKVSPQATALTHRTMTDSASVFTDIPKGIGRVVGALEGTGSVPIGAPFTIFHQAPDGDSPGEIEMGIPIGEAVTMDADDLTVADLPETVVAALVHVGSYADMGRSYAAMAAWVEERGHRLVGPTREIYLNSPADVAEDALQTELLFPIDADVSDVSNHELSST